MKILTVTFTFYCFYRLLFHTTYVNGSFAFLIYNIFLQSVFYISTQIHAYVHLRADENAGVSAMVYMCT